jgi:cardiolipin synthase
LEHAANNPATLAEQADKALQSRFRRSRSLRITAVIAILALLGLLLVALFGPILPYRIAVEPQPSLASQEFFRQLAVQSDASMNTQTSIEAIPNGNNFYEAELAAMRGARHSIDLEAYIFHEGITAKRFVDVMTERARAGVKVNLVLDSLGCESTHNSYFRDLTTAGGRVGWYHSIRWYNWMRSNNRTHRELLIIDGNTGFIGGAGVADWWAMSTSAEPRWRDNMFRVRGDAVASLQGTFLENWLESSGEVLSGPDYFPEPSPAGTTAALVVNSTPSVGGSTRSRVLFQVLLASARNKIVIATPYFVPDASAKQTLIQARQRGVQVQILVPGPHMDIGVVRASSRSEYGDLLKAGIHIYEYQPSMIHTKLLVIDGLWVVVGSTNFDNRSFGINDEVNLAARDPQLASTVTSLFDHDVAQSSEITYREWSRRGPIERAEAWFGWLFERQQ